MEFYIQGSPKRTKEIEMAFKNLGYDTIKYFFNAESNLYFTFEGEIRATNNELFKTFIKSRSDYKELELPVKPKFKVGDWITNGTFTHYIVSIVDGFYYFYGGGYLDFGKIDGYYHLWTIEDAKDGDVITNGKLIVIFNKLEEPTYKQRIVAYVGLDLCDRLQFTEDTWKLGVDKAMPATKEQRDLLFSKMEEAGYQWDAVNKELKKIQPHYNISNFNPFDKVLVRCSNDEEWMIEFYCKYDTLVHTSPHRDYPFMGIGDSYSQCIPYNDDTKHLLGTNDMCDERFINW